MTTPQPAASVAPAARPLVITTGALTAAVCVFALVCAVLLGLYALAPHRPDITPLFGAIPGAVAAIATMAFGWLNRRGHVENGAKLDVITHQTNGVLDAKITRAVTLAVSSTVPLAVQAALAAHRNADLAGQLTSTGTLTFTSPPAGDAATPPAPADVVAADVPPAPDGAPYADSPDGGA